MFDNAKKIVEILNEQNYQAVYAGGCVRDMIMGNEPNDIDIATNADPDTVENIFKQAGFRTIPVGKAFGVIVVVIDKVEYEIATFRNDGNYSDGRRPDSVEFSTIEDDCKRRDFTINGMYYDPIKEEYIDLVGGRKDINNKEIRFIGNANDRIEEDHLRMLRAVRFSGRLGFFIDYEAESAILNNQELIKKVSAERVHAEIEKIFKQDEKPATTINQAAIMGLLPDEVVGTAPFFLAESFDNRTVNLCWAALTECLKHQGIHDREAFLKSFKMSNNQVKYIIGIINDSKKMEFAGTDLAVMKRLHRNPWVIEAAEFAEAFGEDNCEMGAALAKVFHRNILTDEYINPKPLITGDDLIEMGVEKGPIFRDIKVAVEDAQLREDIFTKDEAMKIVNRVIKENS